MNSIRKYTHDFMLYHSYGDFMIQEFRGSLYDDPSQPMDLPLISLKKDNLESVIKKLLNYFQLDKHMNLPLTVDLNSPLPVYLEAPYSSYHLRVDDLVQGLKSSLNTWFEMKKSKPSMRFRMDEKVKAEMQEQIDNVIVHFSEILGQVEDRVHHEIWNPMRFDREAEDIFSEEELENLKKEREETPIDF